MRLTFKNSNRRWLLYGVVAVGIVSAIFITQWMQDEAAETGESLSWFLSAITGVTFGICICAGATAMIYPHYIIKNKSLDDRNWLYDVALIFVPIIGVIVFRTVALYLLDASSLPVFSSIMEEQLVNNLQFLATVGAFFGLAMGIVIYSMVYPFYLTKRRGFDRKPWIYGVSVLSIYIATGIVIGSTLFKAQFTSIDYFMDFSWIPSNHFLTIAYGAASGLVMSGGVISIMYPIYISKYRRENPNRRPIKDIVAITVIYITLGISPIMYWHLTIAELHTLASNVNESLTLTYGSIILGLSVGGISSLLIYPMIIRNKRKGKKIHQQFGWLQKAEHKLPKRVIERCHAHQLFNEANADIESGRFERAKQKEELARSVWTIEGNLVIRTHKLENKINEILGHEEVSDINKEDTQSETLSNISDITRPIHKTTQNKLEGILSRVDELYEDWGQVELEGKDKEELLDELNKKREEIEAEVEKLEKDFKVAVEKDGVRCAMEDAKQVIEKIEQKPAQEIDIKEIEEECRTARDSLQDEMKTVDGEYLGSLRKDAQECLDKIDKKLNKLDELQITKEFEDVRDEIEDAEEQYQQGEYYKAREGFRDVSDQLERLLSRAANLEAPDKKEQIRNHLMAAKSNSDKAQQAIYSDGEPPELAEPGEEVETMDASEFGGQALETPPRREVGSELRDELPEHEVLEHIGSGGNADVHKIRLKETGEVAALKVPQWEGTLSTDVVEDFTDEAETWDKLDSHDNIVEVLNWGSAPYPWMVLEYMDGSLRETTDSLGVGEKLELLASTADALEYAHGHGVVHLDIKPENVLTSGGTPKIADWGLSQVLLTHTQTQMGLSAPYAAPEQLTDDMGKVDRQTDVYQLGVLSYEVLTGRLPFDTEKMADLQRKILEETPEPPSQVNDALPQEVDEVVLKAMAKSKDERYDAVVLFRNAIQNIDAREIR